MYDKNKQVDEVSKWWNLPRNSEKWDRVYQDGSLHSRLYLSERIEKVLNFFRQAGIGKGSRILDLGYGAGQSSVAISSLGSVVYGLDIGEGLCQKANARAAAENPRGEFHLSVGNLEEKFPYESNSFDAASVIGAMQYLNATDIFISEVHRVLKPGGVFVVAQRNIYSLSNVSSIRGFLRTLIQFVLREPFELQLSLKSMLLESRLRIIFNRFNKTRLFKSRFMTKHHQDLKYLINKRANSYFSCKRDLIKHGFDVIAVDGAYYPMFESGSSDNVNRACHDVLSRLSKQRFAGPLKLLGRSFVILARKPHSED